MDNEAPTEEFAMKINSSLIVPNCIGVDFGTERTKIVLPSVTNSESGGSEFTLHFVTFESKNFDAVLNYLSDKLAGLKIACDKDCGWKLRITGVGASQRSNSMKQRLGIDLEIVDESSSDCRGFTFLMRHCDQSDTCHPPPSFDPAEFANMEHGETFKKLCDAQIDSLGGGDSQFPCLLTVFGSTCRVFLIHEDGRAEEMHAHHLAGKSFLGICQLLAGVRDYPSAMSMAASGRRANIDLQIRELLAGTPNSPYGRLPPSLPVFPFGKAVDNDVTYEETRPQDLVHSLVATFGSNLIYTVTQLAGFNSVRCLRFAGGFFNHESPRVELIKTGKLFTAIDSMDVKFVRIGHTAALGAILASASA